MELPSKLLENAVNEMAQLPGIGKRTALRLVLYLLKQPSEQTEVLSSALTAICSWPCVWLRHTRNCSSRSESAVFFRRRSGMLVLIIRCRAHRHQPNL